MSHIKLKHPYTGKEVSFEFGHAQRILKLQVDDGTPKTKCWSMVKESPKKDDNKSAESKSNTKGAKEHGS